MKETLNEKCQLFIQNRDAFKMAFPWENAYFYPICASFFTENDKLATSEALKEIRKLLKSRVGVFSNFRSAGELSLVAMLAVCDEPERRLEEAIAVYGYLKKHFFGSEFLPVAAMVISGAISYEKYEETCERTRRIYDLMKKEHPFLTSSEDSVFAAMLAISNKDDETLIREIETCYVELKGSFYDRNALQSLSHVLALTDDGIRTARDKCRDTVRLFEILKERKYRYGTGYELSTLGVLATLPCGLDETASDLIDAAEFLKTQKGYGFWGLGKQMRLLHAAMIVTGDQLGGSDAMSGAAVSSTLSMIAAQQAATCAAITASVAAANAANHS